MLRYIGAIAAGVLTIVLLSTLTDTIMHRSRVFPLQAEPMAGYLWALALAYRALYQVAGGYVTTRLAPARPVKAVHVLAALGIVLSAAGVAATWNAGPQFGPRWYSLGLVVLAAPTVWFGAWLHARRARS